jgi:hypothetical protein
MVYSRRHARTNHVSATEAAKNFGRLVNRIREERATYIVDRGGMPVARIGPPEMRACTLRDFRALLDAHRRRDDEFARAVETVVRRHNRRRVRRNPWER